MAKELKSLSASLIKTWETCSWLYYAKYVLRLPDTSNDGARRGTLCHKVFELLQNPRHRSHFELIHKSHSVSASTAVSRLVLKLAMKAGINDEENLEMVHDMIPVGLKHDFLLEGAESKEKPEYRFDVTDDQNRFRIKGFIDLLAFFKDHAVIRDFKTSKAKFGKAELNPNLQNLIYSWFVYFKFKVMAKTQFLFLRFPKQPLQEPTPCTLDDLQGAEEYFAYVSDQIQDFNEEKGKLNFATRSRATKWLCGSSEPGKWCCSYRKPFAYYALLDSEGKVKRTSFVNDLIPGEGETVERKKYSGCPRYYS